MSNGKFSIEFIIQLINDEIQGFQNRLISLYKAR